MTFDEWWNETGSAARPLPTEDAEEHAQRVSRMAWEQSAKRSEGLEYAIREALEQWEDNAHNSVRYTLLGALE